VKVVPGNFQAVGDRKEQQDAFGFTDKDDAAFVAHGGVLAVVADGMGGMALGRQASQRAVSTILKAYTAKSQDETIPVVLTRALRAANAEVVALAEEANLTGNVGTTMVAAVVHDGHLDWVSVGDSHLYLYRAGELTQLSTDHVYATVLNEAVRDGRLSQAEADCHPERQSLTSYVGVSDLTEIDSGSGELHVGDRLLLCSDGLYGALSDSEMARELHGDPHQAAEELINQALAKGHAHQDNLTAVVMAWETDERLQQQHRQQRKPDLSTQQSSLRIRVGVAVVLAWVLGFAMGRSWDLMKDVLATSEQVKNATSLPSASSETMSHATTAQEPTTEGEQHE
jgi:protein phosphatase